jgi:PAS domain S-box-containing protein
VLHNAIVDDKQKEIMPPSRHLENCLNLNSIEVIMNAIDRYLTRKPYDFLDCIQDIVAIIDKDGVIVKTNKAFSRITGVDPRPFFGTKMQTLVDKGVMKQSTALKAIKTRKPVSMNITYYNGVSLMWTFVPVFDDRGDLLMVVGTGRDITELVEFESKLRESESVITEYSQQIQVLKESLGIGSIIYSSEAMQRILRTARKAANIDSPVMIWGETGVGKEMVAQFIHQSSIRNEKPFITINCAAIPEELLESELFGYETGSFTGAKKSGKKGLFDEADGGMVFLDEIGELPLRMQSKMLRFLQEHKFMRIGGHRMIDVDVRIISATNLTQEQLMNQMNFRQDLFYRISVIPVYIPPLRERRDDIFPLIRHFVKQFNLKYQTDVQIPPRLMSRLYHYAWPGNIRELKNFAERLIALAESREVGEKEFNLLLHLNSENREKSNAFDGEDGKRSSLGLIESDWEGMPLKDALQKLEATMIRKAYEESGSIVKAAKALGINPSTIHRKMKKDTVRLR